MSKGKLNPVLILQGPEKISTDAPNLLFPAYDLTLLS